MSCGKGKSVGKHYKLKKQAHIKVRCLASISILAFILMIGLWVPLALASDGESGSSPGALTMDQPSTASGTTTPAPSTAKTAATTEGSADTTVASSSSPEQAVVEPVVSESSPAAEESESDATVADGEVSDATAADTQAPADDVATSDDSDDTESATPASSAPENSGTAAPEPAPAQTAAATTTTDESAGGDQYGGCEDCDQDFDLDLICGDPYWASQYDYEHGLLSIMYEIHNNGPGNAYNVRITSATATNGVTPDSYSDLTNWDEIAADSSVYLTIKWLVPENVTHFVTSIEICTGCTTDDENAGDDQYNDAGDDQYNNDDNNDDGGDDGGQTIESGGSEVTDPGTTHVTIVRTSSPVVPTSIVAAGSFAAAPAGSLPSTGFTLLPVFVFAASSLLVAACLLFFPALRTARKDR